MAPQAIPEPTDGWAGDRRPHGWVSEQIDGDTGLSAGIFRRGPRSRRERLALLGLVFVVALYVVIPVAAMLAV